jgi:serine/threonine protein kinase
MTSANGGSSEQSTKIEPGAAAFEAELPREGDIIAGKYRVESVLGKGGMGVVVSARHTSLRQHVAVKFLLPKALQLPGAKERFLREARAAVSIKSEHVARVIDIGELETGAPYMVMEYLRGVDFGQTLKDRGPLPAREAVDYILQACEALAEAHALGIVHRDLKPGNLFLAARADGSALVKVLDFGLSKATRTEDEETPEQSLTATGIVVGSPHYMSPEQLRSLKQVDTRADVWALGVILYQLLSGRRPFEADSMVATCAKIAADPPIPLRERKPDVPVGLEAIILRCLEKDVTRRIQSVAELARCLAPFGSERAPISVERIVRVIEGEGATSTVPPEPVKDATSGLQDATAASGWGQSAPETKKNKSAMLGAGMGAAALVIALAMVVWTRFGSEPVTVTTIAPTAFGQPPATAAAAGAVPVVAPATTAAVDPAPAAQSAAASASAAAFDPAPASAPASANASAAAPAAVTATAKARPASAPATTRGPSAAPASTKPKDSVLDQWN